MAATRLRAVRVVPRIRAFLSILAACALAGCAAGPGLEELPPPPAPAAGAPAPASGPRYIYSGASDSVSVLPGSPGAAYRYRFRQIEPMSDRFQFRDRDLTFHFRPTPGAVHFQLENLQDRPVWIDWDRSVFHPPVGSPGKIAHANSRWDSRFRSQGSTQIPGLQRYSDYLFPMDYLVDPAGSAEQLHLPLLPEDQSAPQYSDAEFGVDLVFLVEDRPRTYTFRFKVASVLPR